jgi:hypothetical protein
MSRMGLVRATLFVLSALAAGSTSAGGGADRTIEQIAAGTIPNRPPDRPLNVKHLKSAVDGSARSLFRRQHQTLDRSFCQAQCCVDFLGDGRRELLFASRGTRAIQMLDAASGAVRWSRVLEGEQQSIAAYDLQGDGLCEILYSVSHPGRLYVLDAAGNVLKHWDADDWKLGNSPVILDADRDGVLDGYFGSRTKHLYRMNMRDLTVIAMRSPWSQCGCYTTAMDVDRDGAWDLFAGSGDDQPSRRGVLHRYDPVSLNTVWSFPTDDNAASADAVLADIDGDGRVEIIKSVDNYGGDVAHDAIYAFETDGKLLWKVEGLREEDSPNAADLDGDGSVEIVGMTFGSEVYCLDGRGRLRWRRDLRPELDDRAHAYLTPILCDLDGDKPLEILALTNGGYFDSPEQASKQGANGVLFALSAAGEVLDRFDVGGPRYWGEAFVANVDDDPQMELVVSGGGGVDVIETRGYGPNTEHFERRRDYQRLNVVPWAYEDSYFIRRGKKTGVENRTDNLVLARSNDRYGPSGTFLTELLAPPPGCFFDRIGFEAQTPPGAEVRLRILDQAGHALWEDARSGQRLHIERPVRLEFSLSSRSGAATPLLDSYRLTFDRR